MRLSWNEIWAHAAELRPRVGGTPRTAAAAPSVRKIERCYAAELCGGRESYGPWKWPSERVAYFTTGKELMALIGGDPALPVPADVGRLASVQYIISARLPSGQDTHSSSAVDP